MQDEMLEVTGVLMVTEGFQNLPTGKAAIGIVTDGVGTKRLAIAIGSTISEFALRSEAGEGGEGTPVYPEPSFGDDFDA